MIRIRRAVYLQGVILLTAIVFVTAVSKTPAAERRPRPNFLFLLADDLGWGDLGCYGHPYIKTPNIDRLASEGTRFECFYVCGSVCHPSRASFMTGQFLPHCFGDVHNLPDGRRVNVSMAPGSIPVTHWLQKAGYATAHIGKWHLNTDALHDPAKYGLDIMQSGKRKDMGDFPANMGARNGQDQKLARAAIQFMKEHREQPFYLQLWFTVPHSPVIPSAEELEVYKALEPKLDDFEGFTREHFTTRANFEKQMRAWCAQITGHDRVVGEVLAALEEMGLAGNTVVFYSSDNGPAPPARTPDTYHEEINAMGSAGPYRARKFTYYEGGIRVPAIIRWPGHVRAGRIDKKSIWAAADWLPTVCSLAGVDLEDYQPDGRDVTGMLCDGASIEPRQLVWGLKPDRMAIRDGDWKLDEFRGTISLFDLSNDPYEQKDLAARETEVTERLQTRLSVYRQRLIEAQARGIRAAEAADASVGGESARRKKRREGTRGENLP
jgi:N-acetylgalactosamine-6-sulfatase